MGDEVANDGAAQRFLATDLCGIGQLRLMKLVKVGAVHDNFGLRSTYGLQVCNKVCGVEVKKILCGGQALDNGAGQRALLHKNLT